MKNVIVSFFTILIVGLMAWTASNGGAYNGGEHSKVIADIGDGRVASAVEIPKEKSDKKEDVTKKTPTEKK